MLMSERRVRRVPSSATSPSSKRGDAIAIACLLFAAWACFGFLFGLHWIVLAFASSRFGAFRQSESAETSKEGIEKRSDAFRLFVRHAIFYTFMTAITAAGGGWARGDGHYTDCGSNVTMSRECLFNTQTTKYQIIYVIHYISLGTQISHWVLDGTQLYSWMREILARRGEFALFHSPVQRLVGDSTYYAIIAIASVLVTLSWSVGIDWNTEINVGRMGIVLIGQLIAIGSALIFINTGSASARKGQLAAATADDDAVQLTTP